jgi:HEAT repeat protein
MQALEDKSISLRLSALKSLGQLHYTPAAPAVRTFFACPDPRLRRMAALTAGQLGDRTAAPMLLKLVDEDQSPLVRPAAVEALAFIGDASLLPRLYPLVDDTNAYIRAALAHTLAALDDGSPTVQATLLKLAEDKVEYVALAAQRALQARPEQSDRTPDAATPHPIADKKPERSWLRRLLGG